MGIIPVEACNSMNFLFVAVISIHSHGFGDFFRQNHLPSLNKPSVPEEWIINIFLVLEVLCQSVQSFCAISGWFKVGFSQETHLLREVERRLNLAVHQPHSLVVGEFA